VGKFVPELHGVGCWHDYLNKNKEGQTQVKLFKNNKEQLELLSHQIEYLAELQKQLNADKDELIRLRGLIGQTCDDCAHKPYCKHVEEYDTNWMLGCQNWQEAKVLASDDISRYIGKVDKILWMPDK
jgi:hypothetical protein